MFAFYPSVQIPFLCLAILLWILCCHLKKKCKEEEEEEEGLPLAPDNSPSIYVIPIYEEEQEDEEVMDIYEAYFQPYYRNPPLYSPRTASPPPPYRLEAPSHPDHLPSYTDLPAYSEQS